MHSTINSSPSGGITNPWHRFFQAVQYQQLILNSEQRTRFSRAQARLRIARGFNGINLSGVNSATARGYSTGMGIFLVYSALEALATAMGEKAYTWHCEDQPLANRLNKLLSGVGLGHPDQNEAVSWLVNNSTLIKTLKEFKAEQHHDALPIARGLRVMVAHGSFTTHGLKMFTKRECEAVEELRQLIFKICDQHLSEWLDAQLSSKTGTVHMESRQEVKSR